MLNLKKIAITGGVASGKTTVCRFFEELGACVVSADQVVHDLLNPNTILGQQIIRKFGSEIFKNGQICRESLAKKVFEDPKKLEELEALLHPTVIKKIEEYYKKALKEESYSSFVVEIPLLYEIKAENFYDVVITVITDSKEALKRFKKAGFSETEYENRMKRQLNPEEKAAKAHYIIRNDSSFDDLRNQVIHINKLIHQQ